MKKRILLALGSAGAAAAIIPLFAAFEAHVINVTAKIENALQVQTEAIEFGTVFPEEVLFKDFGVQLSDSFREEGRVDDVEYHIKQKDKPIDPQGKVCRDGTTDCAPELQISTTQFCHKNRPTDPGDPDRVL